MIEADVPWMKFGGSAPKCVWVSSSPQLYCSGKIQQADHPGISTMTSWPLLGNGLPATCPDESKPDHVYAFTLPPGQTRRERR